MAHPAEKWNDDGQRSKGIGLRRGEFLAMYEISGHGTISESHVARYLEDGDQWGARIHDAVATRVRTKRIKPIRHTAREGSGDIPPNQIGEALHSHDVKVREAAAGMLWRAPHNKRTELIRTALGDSAAAVRIVAATMIEHAPYHARAGLFNQVLEKIHDAVAEPPLYHHGDVVEGGFSRKEFAKTGSEITLLGGTLKGKVILRHLEPENFLVWQSAYENYPLWKENGFEYVPIEAIVSYRLEKTGRVAVFSGVLDANLAQWKAKTALFTPELEHQKNEILKVLEKKGIEHGHMHDGNFCLRLWRDADGHIDLTRVPRLYLIDFDRARFRSA